MMQHGQKRARQHSTVDCVLPLRSDGAVRADDKDKGCPSEKQGASEVQRDETGQREQGDPREEVHEIQTPLDAQDEGYRKERTN